LRDCLEGNSGSSYPGSIYGLSELYRDKMKKASVAANPSSFCTGVVLGLAPLAAGSLVDVNSASIVAKSGITSLRRNDRLTEAGTANNEGIKTYKVDGMKYTEEVNEQMLTLFGKGTPASYAAYIIPGSKGITTTIKVSAHTGISGKDILDIYRAFYKDSPFVEVCTGGMIPSMRNGFNKSFCKIGASVDSDSGEITVTTVLDDVLRGAAGQAIQTMNLMCDIDGKIGL
jgi:N-acetyl-gamma-glutamyl-phosphate reductase